MAELLLELWVVRFRSITYFTTRVDKFLRMKKCRTKSFKSTCEIYIPYSSDDMANLQCEWHLGVGFVLIAPYFVCNKLLISSLPAPLLLG